MAFNVLSVITAAAVMVSDLVIIPVTPSPLDFSASGAVISVLEAQSYNRPVECRFLITRKIEQATMLGVLREEYRSNRYTFFKNIDYAATELREICAGW